MNKFAKTIALIGCLWGVSLAAYGQERQQIGKHLFLENLPSSVKFDGKKVNRHTITLNTYSVKGWAWDGKSLLIYKSGNLYRTKGPNHKKIEILNLADYAVGGAQKALVCGKEGFIFQDDEDGDEYYATFAAKRKDKVPIKLSKGTAKTRARHVSNDRTHIAYASSLKDSGIWTLEYQEICDGTLPKHLYEGRDAIYVKDFHPNDQLVLTTMAANSGYKLLEYDITTGTEKKLFQQKSSIGNAYYSKDGRYIFYTTNEGVNYKELYRLDRVTGEDISVIGGIGIDIDFVVQSDDRTKLAVVLNKLSLSHIVVLDTVNLSLISPLSKKSLGVVSDVYFSPDGEKLAIKLSQPKVPSRSGVYDYKKESIKLWTGGFKQGSKKIKLLPDVVTYPTFDLFNGKPRKIPLLAYRPEDATARKPAPVVIFAHGGPASQARPSWSEFYHYIVTEMGIAVLRPNIRGSSGYGRKFEQLDQVFKREDSIKDIGALLDWIDTQPNLDADRVVIAGGSYGGYVSMAALAMYPERFRGGISRVGVLDFDTFLKNTEPNRVDNRRREYGDERDPQVAALFKKISPVRNVHKITKPVLIVQGARDPRVPLQQAEDMLTALKERGVEVSYLLAMNEGHGFSKSKNRTYSTGAQIAFLRERLLKD